MCLTPIGQFVALRAELCSLKWLRQHVRKHILSTQVAHDNFLVNHSIAHPEVANVDVSDPGDPHLISAMQLMLSWADHTRPDFVSLSPDEISH